MKPKVTVLMPVYNGAKYLKTSIESILNQTYNNFCFLIVDDGSTDEGLEIIKAYKDSRIKLLINETNQGLVFSLNKGFENAIGKYLARMDCDDFSIPDRIEKQVEFMESHPDIGVCGSWYSVFNESFDDELYTAYLPTSPDNISTGLFFGCCLCHPSTMLRLKFMRKYHLRYDIYYLHAEDYGLWVRCNQLSKLANIPEVLLHYRVNPTGICSVHHKEQKESTCKILSKNLKNIGINHPDTQLLNLHYKIICGDERILDYNEKKYIREWFNILRAANSVTGYYPEPEFSDLLKMSIFQVCDSF